MTQLRCPGQQSARARIAGAGAKSWALAATAALLAIASMASAQAKPPSVDEMIQNASSLRHNQKYEPAMKACDEVLADARATAEHKIASFDIIFDVHRRQKKWQNIVDQADRMSKVLAGNPEGLRIAALQKANAYWDWPRPDEAVAAARAFVAANAAAKADAAIVQLRLSVFLMEMKKYPESYDEAAKVIVMVPADDKQVAAALSVMAEATTRAGDFPKSLEPLRRLLEEKYLLTRPEWEQRATVYRYGEHLGKLKQHDAAMAHYTAMISRVDPRMQQDLALRNANILQGLERLDEALVAYEKVFTEHPSLPDSWFDAQRNIVEILRKQKKLDQAIAAEKICLDASPDAHNVSQCVMRIAQMLKEIDKDVQRANDFLAFQQFGPAGKDGQVGTADDVANPLAAIAYPSYPAREQAFAKARQQAGDDAPASRARAFTYIYSGHPAEAAAHFAEAFARSTVGESKPAGTELVNIAVRSLAGHAAGLDEFYLFIAAGPDGPDGKPGTADDLKDPFAQYKLSDRTGWNQGGLAALSDQQKKDLRQLEARLVPLAGDDALEDHFRNRNMACLSRIHEALCNWGEGSQARGYTAMLSTASRGCQAAVAQLAQTAARGGQLHFGGTLEFWRQVDAMDPDGSKLPSAKPVRTAFFAIVKAFEKPPKLATKHQPLKK